MQKGGKWVLAIVRIVQAVLIFSIAASIFAVVLPEAFFTPRVDKTGNFWFQICFNIFTNAVFLAVLFFVSRFLQSIKSGDTPFTAKNVRRLKTVSILLIAVEPVQLIFQSVLNAVRPLTADGKKMVTVSSAGGIVLILGLVVFCLALVFEYGAELQKQSDETL